MKPVVCSNRKPIVVKFKLFKVYVIMSARCPRIYILYCLLLMTVKPKFISDFIMLCDFPQDIT